MLQTQDIYFVKLYIYIYFCIVRHFHKLFAQLDRYIAGLNILDATLEQPRGGKMRDAGNEVDIGAGQFLYTPPQIIVKIISVSRGNFFKYG